MRMATSQAVEAQTMCAVTTHRAQGRDRAGDAARQPKAGRASRCREDRMSAEAGPMNRTSRRASPQSMGPTRRPPWRALDSAPSKSPYRLMFLMSQGDTNASADVAIDQTIHQSLPKRALGLYPAQQERQSRQTKKREAVAERGCSAPRPGRLVASVRSSIPQIVGQHRVPGRERDDGVVVVHSDARRRNCGLSA